MSDVADMMNEGAGCAPWSSVSQLYVCAGRLYSDDLTLEFESILLE